MGLFVCPVSVIRVAAFVDGFNLYHAIDRLGRHHLKWVNVRALCKQFAPDPHCELGDVHFFTAGATWLRDSCRRHLQYLIALRSVGVTPVLGKFKLRKRSCFECGHSWSFHEEKETDVNIALHLVRGAFTNGYDRALLISGDSDLVPAVRMVLEDFPTKQIVVIAPIGQRYSMDLYNAAGGRTNCRKMKQVHLEQSLLPREVRNASGEVLATRPAKYDPPG